MAFSTFEQGAETSRPVELFSFSGAITKKYTSAEDDFTHPSLGVFESTEIERGKNEEGPKKINSDFTVKLPSSDPVSKLFIGPSPGSRLRLVAYRFQRDDTPSFETVTVFDGFIFRGSFSSDLTVCTLAGRQELSSAGRQMPPRTFQHPCNFEHYDPDTCRADDTDPAFRASSKTVTGATGNVLTVSGLGSFASGWFKNGYVEVVGGNDFRYIREDDGAGNLTLAFPFRETPTTVNVFAGCDHSTGANGCAKFSNLTNYGGFPFVPTENPFEGELI